MQELTFEQVEEVSGGVIPLAVVLTAVSIDAAAQIAMWTVYMQMR
jgi:lactobin A/cerein 7B family class IIb bacteriocin